MGSEETGNVVRHRPPSFDKGNCLEMDVDLSNHGMKGRVEKIWVMPNENGDYVVACLPFFCYGIQFGDLVATGAPEVTFRSVIRSVGLRTMRVAFVESAIAKEQHEAVHARLIESRLTHEWHRVEYVAILLRGPGDQEAALAALEPQITKGLVQWEVDPLPFGEE